MRHTRRLFLVAIALILFGVGGSYYIQKNRLAASAPKPPKSLPDNVQASHLNWCHYMGEGDNPKAEICAREMEVAEGPSSKVRLRQVELKLFHQEGKTFDRVRSASAEFDKDEGALFSDGEVEITLAVPVDPAKAGRLLTIRSSGVRFEAASGKASTERAAQFTFDLGDGQAVGAVYDPATRELHLLGEVLLNWRGRDGKKPMKIEAGTAVYKEAESKVYLAPWSRLERERLKMEAGDAVVTLDEGNIHFVEAVQAHGADEYPARKLAFGADDLRMDFGEHSSVRKITGVGKARLETVTAAGTTEVNTDRIDLDFQPVNGESVLLGALANGHSVVDSKPRDGRPGRRLASNVIQMRMRPGGEEIEAVETHSSAELDLFPAGPADPRRHMTAGRLWLTYGDRNQLRSARAVDVSTRTEKPPGKDKKVPPPAITSSKDLQAEFDPKTGELRRLEQWQDFQYEAGPQHAKAQKAVLDSSSNSIDLQGAARVWDPSGFVSADHIVLNQETGDFLAQRNVQSTRVPDAKATASGGMLSQGEAVQATADRMSSSNDNRRIVYDGKAVLWQKANRLQADRVTILRDERKLRAEGNVVSQLLDQSAAGAKKKKPPQYTTIRAATLDYSDTERLADYRGGVHLTREGMDVRSNSLLAWLKQETKPASKDSAAEGSQLDRAVADGNVRIFQAASGRTRRATSEHAEYYVDDGKVVLNGGHPRLVDSLKGTTSGPQLTYWADSDKFQVDGAETQPGVSILRRN